MRSLRRRRRDELDPLAAEIARERLPIPGHPVPARRGGVLDVLRRKEAVIISSVLFAGCSMLYGGWWAGTTMQEHRQDERLQAEVSRASAEFWALSDAYEAAYDDEMEERGFSEREIDAAHAAAFEEFATGDERGPDLPAPQQTATLEIRDQLNEAEARYDALLDATDPD